MIRIMIVRGTSHCAEQHCGRRKASLNCVRRKRIVYHSQRRAANVLALELKLMAECFGNSLKNENGLLGDFRADAVAGEDSEVQKHAGISLMERPVAVQAGLRPADSGRRLSPIKSSLLHAPEIVFLIVVLISGNGQGHTKCIGLGGQRKRARRFLGRDVGGG